MGIGLLANLMLVFFGAVAASVVFAVYSAATGVARWAKPAWRQPLAGVRTTLAALTCAGFLIFVFSDGGPQWNLIAWFGGTVGSGMAIALVLLHRRNARKLRGEEPDADA